MSVICNSHGCGGQYDCPGELAAHRVEDHDSLPSIALVAARWQFGFETQPPVWDETPKTLTKLRARRAQ